MSKGPQGQHRPGNPVGCAVAVAQIATGEREDSACDASKQPGGKVGGTARAQALSSERRSEIARTAAKARWAKTG